MLNASIFKKIIIPLMHLELKTSLQISFVTRISYTEIFI